MSSGKQTKPIETLWNTDLVSFKLFAFIPSCSVFWKLKGECVCTNTDAVKFFGLLFSFSTILKVDCFSMSWLFRRRQRNLQKKACWNLQSFFWAIKPLFFWRSRYRRRSCLARSLFQCYTNNCWFPAEFSRGVRILVHPPEAKGSYESDWTIIYLFFFLLVSADAFFKASISLIPEVPRTIGKSGGSVLSCYPLLISPDS